MQAQTATLDSTFQITITRNDTKRPALRKSKFNHAISRYQQTRSSLGQHYGPTYNNFSQSVEQKSDEYIEQNTVQKKLEGFRVKSVSDYKKLKLKAKMNYG